MNIKPDIYKQRTPCADCPFRREGGVRHSLKLMLSYISYFCGFPGATFPCHKSVPADDPRDQWSAWREGQVLCAGGMIFALKQGMSNAVMLAGVRHRVWSPAMYDAADVAAVFNSVDEMLAASSDVRCESTLSGMRCELAAGHGRYHKHHAAGWEDAR